MGYDSAFLVMTKIVKTWRITMISIFGAFFVLYLVSMPFIFLMLGKQYLVMHIQAAILKVLLCLGTDISVVPLRGG